jgi:hypothetical protein
VAPAPTIGRRRRSIANSTPPISDANSACRSWCCGGTSAQLRNDQAKLLDLQDRIARLDKALEQLGNTGK